MNGVSRVLKRIQARLKRRFSVLTLGPNEARVLYDGVASTCALLVSLGFSLAFLPDPRGPGRRDLLLFSVPLLLIGFNTLFGIYSALKTARGRVKALVLLGSVCSSCVCLWLLTGRPAPTLLWGFMVYGPLALPRVLLGLPHTKYKRLAAVTVNIRGPVLVIGGAGYIGSHTVELLLEQGQAVRVLDRLMYGSHALSEFIGRRQFELIEGDATDISKLTMAMKDASAVVHLAGLVGDPACAVDTEFTRHTNIVATRMAKDVAQSLGIHRFIFASSCSVYGTTDKEARENDTLNPVSLYAQTKIDSEQELLYSGRDDFFVTILRFATVFGHSRRPRFDLVANLFTAQAMADGLITVIGPSQWRPFIHVRDLARAVVSVLRFEPAIVQNQIFNVGDRRMNMTILQLAETVRRVVAKHRDTAVTVSEDTEDRRNYIVSFEKIRSLLGFEAQISVEAGIEEMAEHFGNGTYHPYREDLYHNAAMTAVALRQFQDPVEMAHLYAPLIGRG
jgi:nucleoside-diphosphate-sugar epimerase